MSEYAQTGPEPQDLVGLRSPNHPVIDTSRPRRLFDPVKFGRRVAAKVRRERLSYREAEAQSGVDHAIIHRVASGKPPTVENYLRLVRWLGDGA